MVYKFFPIKKWHRAGIVSILYVLSIIFFGICSVFSFDLADSPNRILISIILTVFFLAGLYKTMYYFNLHKKDYIIMGDSWLSIYKGSLIPRKRIPFNQVDRVVQINEVLLFKLANGKEEQIYTEWLSNEDTLELKTELKHNSVLRRLNFKSDVLNS